MTMLISAFYKTRHALILLHKIPPVRTEEQKIHVKTCGGSIKWRTG